MKRSFFLLAGLLALQVACDDEKECEELRDLKSRLEEVVRTGVARARMSEAADDQRARAKKRAESLMASLRLDEPEDELTEAFRARADEHADVAFERTTGEVPKTGVVMGASATGGRETVWRFRIDRPRLASIFPLLDELAASPPLARLSQVYPKDGGTGWTVDLARMVIPQVPIEGKPLPLPEPPDPSTVPERLGFCGSSSLRAEIDALLRTYEQVKEKAADTTVALPEAASWKGLARRTRELADLEVGARSVIADVLQAAAKSKAELELVSSDGEAVTVEYRGGKKTGTAIQQRMRPEFAASVREVPAPSKLTQNRFIVPNPVAVAMRSPVGEGHEGHEGHEETGEVGGLGLPPPEQLKQMLDKKLGKGKSPSP